jgi:hypothetical protein
VHESSTATKVWRKSKTLIVLRIIGLFVGEASVLQVHRNGCSHAAVTVIDFEAEGERREA